MTEQELKEIRERIGVCLIGTGIISHEHPHDLCCCEVNRLLDEIERLRVSLMRSDLDFVLLNTQNVVLRRTMETIRHRIFDSRIENYNQIAEGIDEILKGGGK